MTLLPSRRPRYTWPPPSKEQILNSPLPWGECLKHEEKFRHIKKGKDRIIVSKKKEINWQVKALTGHVNLVLSSNNDYNDGCR
jgi:hypothetical protein